MYAMLVSLYHDTGLFTPLYHIASSIGSPKAMMESMKAAMASDSVTFVPGTAALGVGIHMMIGAVAGVVFAFLTGLRSITGMLLVIAGVAYGLLVMAVNSLVVLPLTARAFGGGETIAEMGSMVGWTTFTVEHIVYGLVLGLLLAAATRSPRRAHGSAVAHRRPVRS
jgi:hypothetical protein